MPRPRLHPTEAQRLTVKSLAACGIHQEEIAAKIGIRSPKTLRKYFLQELTSGVTEANETPIIAGVPAHIQVERQGTSPRTGLPADVAGQSIWKIIFKLPRGTVRSHDIITDDLGNRYQVIAPDWGPLVMTCHAQILET